MENLGLRALIADEWPEITNYSGYRDAEEIARYRQLSEN